MCYHIENLPKGEGAMKSRSNCGKAFEFEKEFINAPERFGNFILHQMGDVCYESGFSCEIHRQWCYEITCVLSGEGFTQINGKQFPIKTGDMFLTPLGTEHIVTAKENLRYLFIGFDIASDTNDPELMMLASFYRSAPLNTIKVTDDIRNTFYNCLTEHYSTPACHGVMVGAYISELAVSVYRAYNGIKQVRYLADDKINYIALPLYSALLCIDSAPAHVKDVASLSRDIGYSPGYLSHLFRKSMGITLQQYICEKKIDEGVRLMTEKSVSASEAACQLGFSSPQAFTKAFKRIKGMSPTQYLSYHGKEAERK